MKSLSPSELPIDFDNIVRPKPGGRERLLKLIWLCSRRSPGVDSLLTRKLPCLKSLPEINPEACIPNFAATQIVIRQCPVGAWSTPLIDVVILLKCVLGFRSRRILEIGSYLGHTARILAENTDAETRIITLDEYPEHGSAYRGTPLEQKIERRVGKVSLEYFRPDEKFDLIFVDADHRFESVVNDTKVASGLLAENGVLVWHDYQHENHFHGLNGVPEVLKIFLKSIPIIALKGTSLAMHTRYPGWETASYVNQEGGLALEGPWHNQSLRG
jgi:hypothetical protein